MEKNYITKKGKIEMKVRIRETAVKAQIFTGIVEGKPQMKDVAFILNNVSDLTDDGVKKSLKRKIGKSEYERVFVEGYSTLETVYEISKEDLQLVGTLIESKEI